MPLLEMSSSASKGAVEDEYGILGSGPCPDARGPGGRAESLSPRLVEREAPSPLPCFKLLESHCSVTERGPCTLQGACHTPCVGGY